MGQAESQHEKFWEACGYGETKLVEHYIKQGVDVNWISMTHKCRPIHAAACKKPEIIKLLVEAGCDVDALDEAGRTALHHASMKGYGECAELLLDYGTEIDQQDKNGWTALHCASYWGHPETLQILLDHDADITTLNKDRRLALHEACRGKSESPEMLADCVQRLIDVGCETNAVAFGEGTHGTKFTPLMFACYHGYLKVVRVLVKAGCDLDTMGTNGWTAIHWAAEQGQKSICKYLLESGVNRYMPNDRNESALERAKSASLQDLLLNTFPPNDPRNNPVSTPIVGKLTKSQNQSIITAQADGVESGGIAPELQPETGDQPGCSNSNNHLISTNCHVQATPSQPAAVEESQQPKETSPDTIKSQPDPETCNQGDAYTNTDESQPDGSSYQQ